MKTVLMSIQPKWCGKIINGEKTIEVRKTAPKEVPFKVYIYCTEGGQILREAFYPNGKPDKKYFYLADRNRNHEKNLNGKIIGEFICDKVDKISVHNDACYSVGNLFANKLKNMCLTVAELKEYLGAKNNGYAIGITALKIYDKPRELGEFYKPCKNLSRGAHNCNNCDYSKFKWYGESTHIICRNTITRPPQSWQYIQELEEQNDNN